ncbi:MAG: hypothetical protein Q9Q40_02845 [Acidobacteriota bacterium]|nr:hypothetical protein [Acidobacteriota bacterium]MDQ7088863.1 hypothetical protein [Acidobacteriota bacterium]
MRMPLLILAALALSLAACGGGEQPAAPAETPAPEATAAETHTETKADAANWEVGQAVEISGTLGCAHCTYHVTDSCAAAIQTADGGYVVLDSDQESELFTKRYDKATVEVQGTIAEAGDPPKMHVESYDFGS